MDLMAFPLKTEKAVQYRRHTALEFIPNVYVEKLQNYHSPASAKEDGYLEMWNNFLT